MKNFLVLLALISITVKIQAQTLSLPTEIDTGLLIETELQIESFDEADNGTKKDTASDLVVSTVSLGFAAELSDQVTGELAFLYEEDNTNFEVDIATLDYAISPEVSATFGQYYVPFGVFESHFISDPLTLELGEIRETALEVSYVYYNLSFSSYFFDGDVNKLKEGARSETSKLNNYGASFGWSWKARTFDVLVRADYLNSIVETDSLQGDPNSGFTSTGVSSFEAGYNLFGRLDIADFTLIAEWTSAADGIITVEGYDKVYEPSATNMELAYQWGERTVAVSYQSTKEAATLGLPEDRIAGVIVVPVIGGFEFSTEAGVKSGYDNSYPSGTGEDSTYFVAKLALEI